MKTCSRCQGVKEPTEFYHLKTGRGGVMPHCKVCANQLVLAWGRENKDRRRATRAIYRHQHPDRVRGARLMKDYGISYAQYDDLLWAQAGLCAICTEPMRPGSGTHVDHDHKTGQVRGLLCNNCNRMLGHGRDNALNLTAGAAYLERAA